MKEMSKRQRLITDFLNKKAKMMTTRNENGGFGSYSGYGGKRRNKFALLRGVRSKAMTRVHQFKRFGAPLIIQSDPTSGTGLTITGNTSMVTGGAISTVAGSLAWSRAFGFGLKFNISNLTTIADITNLFDQYRFKNVKLIFSLSYNSAGPEFDSASTLGARSSSLPIMNIANDPDDAGTPAGIAAVQELGTCKVLRLGDGLFSHYCKPRAQQLIAGTTLGNANNGMLPTNVWINDASVVDHFGVKVWIDQWPSIYPLATGNDRGIALTITPVFTIEAKTIH